MLLKKLKASLIAYLLFRDESNIASCSNSIQNNLRTVDVYGKTTIPLLPDESTPWFTIRKYRMVYVDKTSYMKYFLQKHSFLCVLIRPRRFGKSVFLSTLEKLFRGENNGTELFEGTDIFKYGNTHNLDGTWVNYPVIRIDLSGIISDLPFWDQMHNILTLVAKQYEVPFDSNGTLSYLIKALYDGFDQPVVILVDEYDILLNNEIYGDEQNATRLQKIKTQLTEFYQQIKLSSEFIKVAVLIGVNRYSQAHLTSGPNCFKDLTYNPHFSNAFGFTEQEISDNFGPHITDFANKKNRTPDQVMSELRDWYDGYVFSDEDTKVKIFNPISVIQSLSQQRFGPYWSSTGSIKSIVKSLYNGALHLNEITKTIDRKNLYKTYDAAFSSIPINHQMLNTGYLTISKIIKDEIILTIPNKEVEEFLFDHYYSYIPSENSFLESLYELTKAIKINLNNFEVSALVENLNKICFPLYKNALAAAPEEYEVNRRLVTALNFSQIAFDNPQLNKPAKTGKGQISVGDLDIVTTGLQTNYVIELKSGALQEGIEQIMRYFSLLKGYTGNKTYLYLLVMSYEKTKTSNIEDWVAIPCKNDNMMTKKAIVSSKNASEALKKALKKNSNELSKFKHKNKEKQGDSFNY